MHQRMERLLLTAIVKMWKTKIPVMVLNFFQLFSDSTVSMPCTLELGDAHIIKHKSISWDDSSPFLEMNLFLKNETSHLFTCNKASTHSLHESTMLFLIHKRLAFTGPTIHITQRTVLQQCWQELWAPATTTYLQLYLCFCGHLPRRFIPPSQQ